MLRNYNWLSEEMLSVIEKREWKPLLYAMCFLHTTVVERKRFGPLGWNVPYEFNQSDLSASLTFLQTHLYQMDAKKGISWSTVRYMVCEVHYGGRITDDHDRHLMNTYGEVWLDSSIFQPKFRFGNDPQYMIPVLNKQAEYLEYIESKIPIYDSPQAFGMHPNANITYRNQQAATILDTILQIQPKEASGSGETPEEIVLRTVENMMKNLPPDFIQSEVRQAISQLPGAMTMPLNIFLKQEIDRMQVVIRTIRLTCKDLELAIAGTIVMSATLQTTLTALFDSKVPEPWLRVSWLSPTLGFWFGDVGMRTRQLQDWMKLGRPKTFWLTGFFNPQGFLTSMRQEITRAHGWALDTVALTTEVTKFLTKDDVKAPPEEGVYVHGLFLDGAAWDASDMRLIDSAPKVLYSPLNVVWVSATNTARSKDNTIYVCPCYKVPKRTGLNYIFEIDLSTRDPPEKWTMRGVALLCSKQ
jgi:dynein heavy chain